MVYIFEKIMLCACACGKKCKMRVMHLARFSHTSDFNSLLHSRHVTILVPISSLLGSGPEGVDDLCFHTGEFSPLLLPPPPSPPFSRPISQHRSQYPSLKAHIPVLRSKSLEAGIWASKMGFWPEDGIWALRLGYGPQG